MRNMRIIISLSIILLFGCEMQKSAEFTYMETNAVLVDSIRVLYLSNDEGIATIEDYNKEKGIYAIRNLNYQIDQVKNAMISDSDQAIDKRAVNKYLSDGELLQSIGKLASACEDILARYPVARSIQPQITSPDGQVVFFDGKALYEVVPELNKWILNNERVIVELLLNQE